MPTAASKHRRRKPASRRRTALIALELPVSHDLTGDFTRLAGVLRAERGLASDGAIVKAIALDVPLTGTPTAGPKPALALPANDWQAALADGRVDAVAAARARLRVRGRPAPEPDAVRISGAVAEGAGARDVACRRPARAAIRRRRLRGGRRRRVRRTRRSVDRVPRGRRATGLGLPAPVACRRHRARAPVFRHGAQSVRRVRIRLARAVAHGDVVACESPRQCLRVGTARRRDRIAVHRAVHGRRDGLCARRANAGDARRVRRPWSSGWHCRMQRSRGFRDGAAGCRVPAHGWNG